MLQETISLLPVNQVKITIIMDNSIDLAMSSTEVAKCIPLSEASRSIMRDVCTGWVATHQLARAMPDAFIATSVGTSFLL